MAEEEEAADLDEDAKPAKKKKAKGEGGGVMSMLVNAIGIFVLALGATIVGGMVNAKLHPQQEFALVDGKLTIKETKADEKAGAKEAVKPAFYVELDPPLVVNFDDQQSVRFLQVSMQVLVREEHAGETVKLHSPVIRNNLLQVLNGRDYHELMTRDGKEKLRQECLKEVQKILTKMAGAPIAEDLYFTSFVVQ